MPIGFDAEKLYEDLSILSSDNLNSSRIKLNQFYSPLNSPTKNLANLANDQDSPKRHIEQREPNFTKLALHPIENTILENKSNLEDHKLTDDCNNHFPFIIIKVPTIM